MNCTLPSISWYQKFGFYILILTYCFPARGKLFQASTSQRLSFTDWKCTNHSQFSHFSMDLTPELKWYSTCKTQLKRMIHERREAQILVWIYKWETRFEVAIFFSYESCIAFSTIVTLKVPCMTWTMTQWMLVFDVKYQPWSQGQLGHVLQSSISSMFFITDTRAKMRSKLPLSLSLLVSNLKSSKDELGGCYGIFEWLKMIRLTEHDLYCDHFFHPTCSHDLKKSKIWHHFVSQSLLIIGHDIL